MKRATKFDQDKSDFTQIPQEALLEIARVFTKGGNKYGQFNYSEGFEHRRLAAAALRHINQYLRNEDIDEIGTHHIANGAASLMILLDAILTKKGLDNRNKVYVKKVRSEVFKKRNKRVKRRNRRNS